METAATNRLLPKSERLCGKKAIATLVERGRHGSAGCLRYTCLLHPTPTDSPSLRVSGSSSRPETPSASASAPSLATRIMVSVPKKLFKRAVRRNLLKRRIREAYRLNKASLSVSVPADILFTYSSPKVLSFEEIQAAMQSALQEISCWK